MPIAPPPQPDGVRVAVDVALPPRPQREPRPTRPEGLYAVVLHDDAFNAIDHAARTLARILEIRPGAAWRLAHRAHHHGRVVVWIGAAAAARVVARRLTAAGPDPIMSAFGAGPLDVEVVTTDVNGPPWRPQAPKS